MKEARLNIRITEEVKALLKKQAEKEHRTISGLVISAIYTHIAWQKMIDKKLSDKQR